MSRTRLVTVLLAFSALLMVLSIGCRREPTGRCGRLIADLESPSKAKEAIRQLGERQGEKSCAKAIPQLAQMFKEARYRTDILRSVKHMGKKDATQFKETFDILREGIKKEETDSIAATVIEDWKLSELKGDLVEMLSGKTNPKSRLALLKALMAFAKPEEIEDVLIDLATADPDKQGMRVNVMAIEALGASRSVRGIPAVTKTMFIRDQRGAEMYQAARKTLLEIGGTATLEFLTKTLNGENTELRDFARASGIQDWEWQDGPKIPQVLGDLLDPAAAPVLAADISKKLVPPAGIADQALETWKMTQSNRITIDMLGLARLGSPAVIETLVATVNDPVGDAKQRLDSATGLASIGTPEAVEALFKIYEESGDQRFRAPLSRPLALALDAAHLSRWQDIVKKEEKEKAELVLQRLMGDPIVVASVALVSDCENDETACLLENLDWTMPEGEEMQGFTKAQIEGARQWKAVIMLARKKADADVIIPKLLKKFEKTPPTQTDLRNYILIALDRIGHDKAKTYSGLKKIHKAEKGKGGPYSFWNFELEFRLVSREARAAGEPATE